MAKRRKQPEPPPPALFLRSKSGTPARLVRTQQMNDADEWLWRLDYGNVKGTQLWAWPDLDADGVEWLTTRPMDMPERNEVEE